MTWVSIAYKLLPLSIRQGDVVLATKFRVSVLVA